MHKIGSLSSICYFLLGCIIAVSLAGCSTQDKEDETVALYSGEKILIERDELQAFVDDFMAEQLDQRHIPGLTIIVVQNGQVLLAKGYGSANLEEEVAFDPNETVVRIASISKLFVATAVMQLVEQGKLDLHADVNQYLGDSAFQVDDTFPEPVTLAQLLTHTSGYGESNENSPDPAAIPPLETYLAENMPPRLEPPGESWIYSGHGMAIAALVVEKVSGLPFDQYVLKNILEPLDMSQSYYLLSPPLPDDLALGYVYRDGAYIPQLIEYYGDYPAASLVSTAADMAKFMIAHLQEGCHQDRCILQPTTIADMHQRQTDTEFGGHAYGFVEGIKNGQRLIGHTGAIHGFGGVLDLLPAHDLGYFFSFNLECMDSSACGIIPEFRQQFVDRFLTFTAIPPTQAATLPPPPPTPPPPTATSSPTSTATASVAETVAISAPSLGDTWVRPADGMDLVFVPAGSFQMGSDQAQIDTAISLCEQYPDGWGKCNQAQIFEDEAPPHTVTLDGFWIDRTEVTNAQYELCVQTGACRPSRLAGNPAYNPADYPVAGVPWQQAADYCAWAGGRLPTEAEWEYAARGASGALYPWGDSFDCQGGNFWDDDTDCDDSYPEPAPVGSFPAGASWCGALDMSGNVWEWVSDAYGAYPAADQSNPTGPTSGEQRVLRGGSWGYGPPFVRSAYRYPVPPSADYLAVGFRCAASTTLELGPDETATLASLEQVDDYPLYTLHYYGDYEQTGAAIQRGQWLAQAKPSQGGARACALFAALGDAEHMVYGRNFDWRYSPALLLFTDPPDGYASVSMVDIEYLVGEEKAGSLLELPLAERQELLAAPRWPFDGMNEHGLVIGMAAVPPGQVPPDPDKETLDSLDVMREVLDHAQDVDEALAILQRYNIDMGEGPPLHYLVADPSGRAILFELYEGETVIIPNETPWHLATNFLRASAGESARGECWRYDKINDQLQQSNGQITAQQAMDILSQVSQDNTEWSVVYGMSTGEVMVTMGKKYDDDPHVFQLDPAGE